MSEDSSGPREFATVRDFIARLEEITRALPDGLDTRLELGICDSSGLQYIDSADLNEWGVTSTTDGRVREWFVLLRAHVHPGESPGRYVRGTVSDVDQELRELTEGDDA